MSLLVNYFPTLLQRDASQSIPLLLTCLAWGDGPVCDRAAWALDIIGKPALEALLTNLEAADTSVTARYIGAIRKNSSLHLVAKKTISLLATKLTSPNEEVQFWALTVLMDIGPLRPGFDNRLDKSAFEQIYGELLTAAHQLAPQKQYDFARRYSELLEDYFMSKIT